MRSGRAVTMKQIADALQLSQASVSFALSASWERTGVKTETRDRVLAKAAELGYAPNRAARRLARDRHLPQRTTLERVGWLVVDHAKARIQYADITGMAMLEGAERELAQQDATLTYIRVPHGTEWTRVQRLMQAREVDGWLLYGAITDTLLDTLDVYGAPYLIVGDHLCTRPVDVVTLDHRAGGQQAVAHLVALGHRSICCMVGRQRYMYQREGVAGYLQGMAEHGLARSPESLVESADLWHLDSGWDESNIRRMLAWYRSTRAWPQPPTAIITLEYDLASILCRVLRESGETVPGSLSIVAYSPQSSAASVENHTRLELPMLQIGVQGARRLQKRCAAPDATRRITTVPPALVPGWSSGPAT